MERSEDHGNVVVALAEVRPAPRTEFARELDEWAASGFSSHKRRNRSRLSAAVLAHLRELAPRRFALATAPTAMIAIAVATAVIAGNNSPQEPVVLHHGAGEHSEVQLSELAHAHHGAGAASNFDSALGSAKEESFAPFVRTAPSHLQARHRDIKRAAEIDLLADPVDVSGDSTDVFRAVHDANGIVLHSSTTSGVDAGARFEVLIPSARLGDALTSISAIDTVRYRRDASDDITGLTGETGEKLRSSRARIDSLLAQLAGAETESEREVIGIQLRAERRQVTALRAQLAQLHHRVHYARVQVRIESDKEKGSADTWGFDDAIGSAGHILGIAAGVTLIGLAVLAPIALLCLLAWLARRAWVRVQRHRALANA